MKKQWKKRLLTGTVVSAVLVANVVTVLAGAAPDGKTDANDLSATINQSSEWTAWKTQWETVKNDWTQISLTPGSDESELNFAWYSKKTEEVSAPKLKIGKKQDMSDAKEYTAQQVDVKGEVDAEDAEYYSNKVTVTGLEADTTYYYSYEKNGSFTEPAKYITKSKDNFSFIFVGDPQIGSSNELKGADSEEFYQAQSDSVRSDSFNWEATLNAAMKTSGDKASFVVSAGDQIQTTKKKAPNKDAAKSEIEYTGYLSPDILKNIPVATTVGNHDADNANYTYHFNTPNNSELGSNGIVGGDYWFTYGSALFLMLNTQDTNVAEHKLFIDQAIAANKDCKWRIVTLHQDIYGSAEHSNEPEITNLRYQLTPYFEASDIDVVLTGHDHAYSRSKMLLGGKSTLAYTDDEFDEQLEKDMDNGDSTETLTVAPGNIKDDTTEEAEQKYLAYLKNIMDEDAIETVKKENDSVVNPEGILYMTANSSSGSKYYDLVPRMQSYIAGRWQEDVPTYSVVNIDDQTFSISTYRTDNNEKIDDTFSITKVDIDKSGLETMIEDARENIVPEKISYTTESFDVFKQALAGAESVDKDSKATNTEIQSAILALTDAKAALVKKSETPTQTPTPSAVTATTAPTDTPVATQTVAPTDTPTAAPTVAPTNTPTATQTVAPSAAPTQMPVVSTEDKIATPKKVKLKSVKSAKAKKVVVEFAKVSGKVSGYEVQYSASKKMKDVNVALTTKTKYTLSSLSSKKTYYVRVRAYNESSNTRVYGAYSKVQKVKVK